MCFGDASVSCFPENLNDIFQAAFAAFFMIFVMKNRLLNIKQLHFHANSQAGSQMNWHQTGSGSILVRKQDNFVYFDERITLANGCTSSDFKAWQILSDEQIIFWRQRNGAYESLFTLLLNPDGVWRSQSEYICLPDYYHAQLQTSDKNSVQFTIWIRGARKNECLIYDYQ